MALYVAREAAVRASGSKKLAFLFELDRLTDAPLLEFTGLSVEERGDRSTVGDSLLECLKLRLQQRSFDNDVKWIAPPLGSVEQFSKIIWDAAIATLGENAPGELGPLLEEFARGDLRQTVTIPGEAEPEVHSEPDSYFIFYFAEFALLCLDEGIHSDRWNAVLNSLIKMQALFIARFPTNDRGTWSVVNYGTPAALPAAGSKEREDLEAEFARINGRFDGVTDRAKLEKEMLTNLTEAGGFR